MKEISGDELVKAVHRVALVGGTLIDQVPDIPDGEPLAREWRTFKREVYRLIKEGHAGRFALLKGDNLVQIYDTLQEADSEGRTLFVSEPFLVQEIQLYIKTQRWGYYHLCRD
jgi:hypothetical protein